MSVLSEVNIPCAAIQVALDTAFELCNPVMDAMPLLEAILVTQKATGITQQVSDNGKVKTVKVTYEQRALESSVTETTGNRTCTASNQSFDNYADYTIDHTTFLTAEEKFTMKQLALVCKPFEQFLSEKIAKVIDVLERKAATQVANAFAANYGKWGTGVTLDNGSDELVIPTLVSAATKVIDYSGMSSIDLALMQTGYCKPPIIIGGSKLYEYGQWIQKGCCSTTGVNVLDMANEFGKVILYDKRLEAALGSPLKSMVFQPGAVAIITYNEYDETALSGANYDKLKVFSPRTGLPIDIVIKDDCGTISIIGYLTHKLVALPADMFAVGDEYRGVNFINKILVTNPA